MKNQFVSGQAVDAADAVIKSGRWKIYSVGNALLDYSDLFNTPNLSANSEVLFWKKYDASQNIAHSVSKYTSTGGGNMGITQSPVDDYLTIDGEPFSGSIKDDAQSVCGRITTCLKRPKTIPNGDQARGSVKAQCIGACISTFKSIGF